ncbi:MAG: ATP synthase F1 subunit gamma [Peptococcaceae bacterium]|nr:ATP synthase F1 subunit gamma [Peptococcaceae bacterium]
MRALRGVRTRINNVRHIAQIARAMKAIATVQLARARKAVAGTRPYSQQIRRVLERVVWVSRELNHPLLGPREERRVGMVVVAGDRGMSGGFNVAVVREALGEAARFPEVAYVAVGRKALGQLCFKQKLIDHAFTGLGERITFDMARDIAAYLMQQLASGPWDAVYLAYTRFESLTRRYPVVEKLLPLDVSGEASGAYIFEPSGVEVLAALIPRYVETVIYQALLESKASEHSARMLAMDNAVNNAGEMVNRLTLDFNRIRQANITGELLDIIGGAAAVE